jgi:hypothetical protein
LELLPHLVLALLYQLSTLSLLVVALVVALTELVVVALVVFAQAFLVKLRAAGLLLSQYSLFQ